MYWVHCASSHSSQNSNREGEEKVKELKQLTSENGHATRECLKNTLSRLKKKWKCILLNLVVSTRPLWHRNVWSITALLRSVVFRVFGDKRHLHSSLAPALPAFLTRFFLQPKFFCYHPQWPPPSSPLEKDPGATLGSPTRSIPLVGGGAISSWLALGCALLW